MSVEKNQDLYQEFQEAKLFLAHGHTVEKHCSSFQTKLSSYS